VLVLALIAELDGQRFTNTTRAAPATTTMFSQRGEGRARAGNEPCDEDCLPASRFHVSTVQPSANHEVRRR